MGENPAMSDPDANHAREALAALDHLVVQDIFLTETAYLADVILPASAFPEKTGSFTNTDRLVQMGRQAIDPPGDARQDLWIIQEIAAVWAVTGTTAMSPKCSTKCATPCPASAASPGNGWNASMRSPTRVWPKAIRAIRWCSSRTFRAKVASARFVPADIIPATERPDAEYPMVLITGRQLEHWHTGSMTRRATCSTRLSRIRTVLIHPLDLAALGARPGEVITLQSRRGEVSLYARADDGTPRGVDIRAVLLLRSGDQQTDTRRARSVREDSGVQVLRGARAAWRRSAASRQLWWRPADRSLIVHGPLAALASVQRASDALD